MQTEVRESGRFERTVTVQLGNEELAAATKRAAARISKNMKIKGFRPGRAPLQVVERHVGADYLRSEAVEEAIQNIVPEAIDEAGLDPVTIPTVSAVRDDGDNGIVEIDIVVTLWPVLDALPDFGDIEIEVEDPAVTDEEIVEQIDALREQFAELVDHEGELGIGDFALIDITVEHEGSPVDSAGAKDLMYEIGSYSFIEGIDELLDGAEVGGTVTGDGTLPEGYSDAGGEDVTLSLTIKEGRKKILPELTDEMVEEASEFETATQLRAAIEANTAAYKVHTQRSIFRDKVVEHVLGEVDFDLPDALLDAEVDARVRNLAARLKQSDISLEDYLKTTGQDEMSFIATIRSEADNALSTRVILESIAAIERWEVTNDELVDHVVSMLQISPEEATKVTEGWKADGQVETLTSDILRERALSSLVDSANAVDADGNPVDLTPVLIEVGIERNDEEPRDDERDEEGSEAETVEEHQAESDDEITADEHDEHEEQG